MNGSENFTSAQHIKDLAQVKQSSRADFCAILCIFSLIFLFTFSQPLLAQEASPTPTEKATPTEKDSETKAPKRVPALGEWIRPEPEETPEEELSEEGELAEDPSLNLRRDDAQEKRIFQELLKRYQGEEYDVPKTAPLVKGSVLNRRQKRRISRLENVFRSVTYKRNRQYAPSGPGDERGLPEARVCTLNLQNYSSRTEVRRVTKDKTLVKNHRRKEHEIVEAIAKEACTVVAVQGVVGTSLKRAKEGLEILAEKLSQKSDFSWQAYLGASNHRLAYNGFLVSNYNIKVLTIKNLANEELPRFSEFAEETFYRGPIELVLQVKNRQEKANRELILYTWNWRKLVDGASPEAERARMQMAESLRRYLVKRSRGLRGTPRPIMVVLGDRESGQFAPATRVLEGGLRLLDFRDSGPCRLEKVEKEIEEIVTITEGPSKGKKRRKKVTLTEFKDVCEEDLRRLKLLFGLVGEQIPPPPEVKRVEVDEAVSYRVPKSYRKKLRKLWRESRERTAEIYLFQQDLPAAYENSLVEGRYGINVREVKYLSEKSPLLRIDLNW